MYCEHYYVMFILSYDWCLNARLCRGGHSACSLYLRCSSHTVKWKPVCVRCFVNLVSKIQWLLKIVFHPTYMHVCPRQVAFYGFLRWLVVLCSSGDWTQGLHSDLQLQPGLIFVLKQILTKSLSCSGWAWTFVSSVSASKTAGITGVCHHALQDRCVLLFR